MIEDIRAPVLFDDCDFPCYRFLPSTCIHSSSAELQGPSCRKNQDGRGYSHQWTDAESARGHAPKPILPRCACNLRAGEDALAEGGRWLHFAELLADPRIRA